MDKRVTLEGWEGFMTVRYGPGEWAPYFDIYYDDGLNGILDSKMAKKEVELVRREMRHRRPRLEPEPEPNDEAGANDAS